MIHVVARTVEMCRALLRPGEAGLIQRALPLPSTWTSPCDDLACSFRRLRRLWRRPGCGRRRGGGRRQAGRPRRRGYSLQLRAPPRRPQGLQKERAHLKVIFFPFLLSSRNLASLFLEELPDDTCQDGRVVLSQSSPFVEIDENRIALASSDRTLPLTHHTHHHFHFHFALSSSNFVSVVEGPKTVLKKLFCPPSTHTHTLT